MSLSPPERYKGHQKVATDVFGISMFLNKIFACKHYSEVSCFFIISYFFIIVVDNSFTMIILIMCSFKSDTKELTNISRFVMDYSLKSLSVMFINILLWYSLASSVLLLFIISITNFKCDYFMKSFSILFLKSQFEYCF